MHFNAPLAIPLQHLHATGFNRPSRVKTKEPSKDAFMGRNAIGTREETLVGEIETIELIKLSQSALSERGSQMQAGAHTLKEDDPFEKFKTYSRHKSQKRMSVIRESNTDLALLQM